MPLSVFITVVQPYKKKYMSVIDTLILANMAFLYTALDRNIYALPLFRNVSGISALIPALGLFGFIVYRVLLKKPLRRAFLLINKSNVRIYI